MKKRVAPALNARKENLFCAVACLANFLVVVAIPSANILKESKFTIKKVLKQKTIIIKMKQKAGNLSKGIKINATAICQAISGVCMVSCMLLLYKKRVNKF